jgi:hypothetical protein
LGGGASGPGGSEFAEWATDATSKYGTVFTTSLTTLPRPPERPRLALISGRTADNPALFTQCIAAECSTIFLEKPGAPTVKELQRMKDEALAAGVSVLMGYNKVRQVWCVMFAVCMFGVYDNEPLLIFRQVSSHTHCCYT